MDRTEVTVADYRKQVPGYRPQWSGPDLPAHGIGFAQAKAYAKAVGKELPTEAQWLWAAFAGSDRKFPWVGTSTEGRCNFGTRAPQPVGSYPSGASPFGVLDMAGNVWEWLDDEEAIGGGFRASLAAYERQGFDPLRKPKYSRAKYERTGDEEYVNYQVHPDKNMEEVGLRCVLGL
jgi:formylglycine-generating enzyme required for sulfatase activity